MGLCRKGFLLAARPCACFLLPVPGVSVTSSHFTHQTPSRLFSYFCPIGTSNCRMKNQAHYLSNSVSLTLCSQFIFLSVVPPLSQSAILVSLLFMHRVACLYTPKFYQMLFKTPFNISQISAHSPLPSVPFWPLRANPSHLLSS